MSTKRVVVGGAILCVLAVGVGWRIAPSDSGGYTPQPFDQRILASVDRDGDRPIAAADDPVESRPAPSPTEAVEQFLAAEAAGDHATSLTLLSAADRVAYPTFDAWLAAHRTLPTIISGSTTRVDGAVVTGDVAYEPALDLIGGATPARARVEWRTVRVEGGWLIEHSESVVAPQFPPPAQARGAVDRWLSDQTACRPSDEELATGLFGVVGLADRLCGLDAIPAVTSVGSMDELADPTAVLNAFGAAAVDYVAIVDVDAPTPLQVIAAPLGDRFLVVGIAAPS